MPAFQLLARSRVRQFLAVLAVLLLAAPAARAADITSADIIALPMGLVGSGNGTLDLRMFTQSGSEIQNQSGAFNGDNGNNSLPVGGGGTAFAESYITTAGDLQAFYTLNFGVTTPGQIEVVVFLDLNETGGSAPTNTLGVFDVILNPATVQGSPNPGGDVTSATQNGINQVFTLGGGSKVAMLNPQPAGNIPVVSMGAGFADYAIFTGIDPFALAASDVLLFNVSMSSLNDGSEELFLSGDVRDIDVRPPPPPGMGQIIVKKMTDTGFGTDFQFTGSVGAFSLDASGMQAFDLTAGADYTITETDPSVDPGGFAFVRIECERGANVMQFFTATVDVTNLQADETVTCTWFDDEIPPPPGMATIRIEKGTNTGAGTGFQFTGDLGNFTLGHADMSMQVVDPANGPFNVTETDPSVDPGGFSFDRIECFPTLGNPISVVAGPSVGIDVAADDAITCIFFNNEIPAPPPEPEPVPALGATGQALLLLLLAAGLQLTRPRRRSA